MPLKPTLADRVENKARAEQAACPGRDNDLARTRLGLQPRREIWRGADDSVLLSRPFADEIADHNDSGGYSYPAGALGQEAGSIEIHFVSGERRGNLLGPVCRHRGNEVGHVAFSAVRRAELFRGGLGPEQGRRGPQPIETVAGGNPSAAMLQTQ